MAIDKLDKNFNSLSKEIYHAQTFLSVSEPLSDKQIAELLPSGNDFQMWDNTLVYSYWRCYQVAQIVMGFIKK